MFLLYLLLIEIHTFQRKSFSQEMAVNDLEELSRMFEEGGRLESSNLKTVPCQ